LLNQGYPGQQRWSSSFARPACAP